MFRGKSRSMKITQESENHFSAGEDIASPRFVDCIDSWYSPWLFHFDSQRDGFATTQAQRRDAFFEASVFQRMNQGNQYPRTGCA